MKRKTSELAQSNSKLHGEVNLLRKQCNQHSRHCLMLIRENHRLMEVSNVLQKKLEQENSTFTKCGPRPRGKVSYQTILQTNCR